MPHLAAICRHPVKSLGEENLARAALKAGRAMAWDRVWAVAHGASEFNPIEPEWVKSRNFVIQSTNPALAQIKCAVDEAAGTVTFSHPDLGTLTANPETEGARLSDWLAPIAGASGPPPYRLARLEGDAALTDFPDTHLSIGNLASLRALEEMAGMPLAPIRFRMNLWVDGAAPWEEWDWEGRDIRVGAVSLKITGRVTRCQATNANPETGTRNTDLTRLLHGRFGHMDFGVYATALSSGDIALGDEVTV